VLTCRILGVVATCAVGAVLTGGAATPALAVAPGPAPGEPSFDARAGDRATIPAATQDARTALAKDLGPQATVSADPVTGGLRSVGRADGFLTAPSGADAATVALGYVRDHAAAFGLDGADIASLKLQSRSTSSDGVTHLAFAQLDHGVGAYDSALTANVTADGRLVNAGGAPVHDLAAPSTDPPLGPAAARAAAQRDLGLTPDGDPGTVGADPARTTAFGGQDRARLVTLADPGGDHLAWKLTVAGKAPYVYEVLVDAATGTVLTRHSLTDFLSSSADVVKDHPGGAAAHVDLGPWLTAPVSGSTGLLGPYVHAYPDRNAPQGVGGDAEVAPSSGSDFSFTTTPVSAGSGQHCANAYTTNICTWDGTSPLAASATANIPQAATQVFYYTNTFHDWLAAPPIGFDTASHNFQDTDPLNAEVNDYGGFNNANMTTPPDGQSPRMQMYLFNSPYPAVNGADDASVVYHEYTHGLTNRLVGGDGQANGLQSRQSEAMGEGWSDWYALDFLTEKGVITDTSAPGDELMGAYVTDNTQTGIRVNAIDCAISDTASSHCPGSSTTGPGGFTFGDLGRVDYYDVDHSLFEVHADGEIWSETLWDLRRAIGGYDARRLITSALRLSPKQPSFLDMRDQILTADTIAGGTRRAEIWTVFAARGMGYSATTTSANSTHAVEAFDTPPVAAPGAPSVAAAQLEQDTPVSIPIANPAGTPLTNVHVTLASASAGVTVGQGSADLGTIAGGARATAAFSVRVAATAGCGSIAATTLTIASDQGTQSFPISLPVGSGRSGAFTRSYATAFAIPDNATSAGVRSTLDVGSHGRVGALRVTLAGTHPWIGDLHATLTSPAGTTVDLMERPGIDTTGYFSRGDLVASAPLIFDDAGPQPIQEVADANGAVSGPWEPNQPLARFAGEDRAGTWTLRITDLAQGDTGTLSSWSLETMDPACAVTDAPSGLSADSATFHARLDPGTTTGTSAAFELGATAGYGARSPASALTAGQGLQDLAVSTGGLTPGATYHVRAVVLRNGAVIATGADRTFVAGSDPGSGTQRNGAGTDPGAGTGGSGGGTPTIPGSSTTAPAFTVPKATMTGLAKTVRLDKNGRYTLSFRATPAKTKGTIKVLVGTSRAGSLSFTVPSSRPVKITIKATKKLLATLRKKAGVKATATLRIGVTSFTTTLTIKPYKKPAKR
jgi:subtilisin-like proprotein convertase family protein